MLSLHRADMQDADVLLSWRNDPDTRAACINPDPVERSDHLAWLQRSIDLPDRLLYIALVDMCPAGTVRADRTDDGYELSWTVAPGFRRQGVGLRMVKALIDTLTGRLTAQIKPDNVASIRIADGCGMTLDCEREGLLHFGLVRAPGDRRIAASKDLVLSRS